MTRINLAEFDIGFFDVKKVKVREYLRTVEMWREIVNYSGILLGFTAVFGLGSAYILFAL